MAKKQYNDIDSAPSDELNHFKHHFSITMELDKHPFMMAMAGIAVGLVVLYVLAHAVKSNQSSLAAVPATGVTTDGTTIPNGTGEIVVQPTPVTLTGIPSPSPATNPTPVTPPPTNTGTGGTGTGGSSHSPGTTFVANGINHYVALGGETLSQIASKLGRSSWNSIYAIPENQAKHGGPLPLMDATHARVYVPSRGTVLVY